jgi:DNA-binding beta-propeller fold protein YncE
MNRSLLLVLAVPLLGGCPASSGSYDDDDSYDGAGDEGYFDDDDEPNASGDDDDSTPPPEEEDEFLTTEPRGTDVFVFIANPERDTLTRINAYTREISTIEVGDEPTQVVVSSDYLRAVSFNAGSDSVSIVDVQSGDVVELAVREDFNFIQMSPDGRWVVAFFNAGLEEATFDVDGVRSFTEVSFVDTMAQVVTSFSVGFNPKEVQFANASRTAVVVSDQFLTVADLTTDPIDLGLVDLGADPIDPPVAAEVAVTPDAEHAFVRYVGLDTIQLVNLENGDLAELDGGLDPSDMDLSPSGAEVVVVARESKELRIFDVDDPLAPPQILSTPETSTIGSVVLSADNSTGLLFTTAAAEDRLTFWDRDTDTLIERGLAKPVDAIALSPDGASALIIHTLGDAPDQSDVFTDRHALTVVNLETWLTNPVALESRPTKWTTSNDGRYSLFLMENNRNVGVVDYQSRLVDDVLVPSVPVHVGMMPLEDTAEDALGWVSQEHELGRISFLQPSDLSVETVTGFELNSAIE